MRPTELDLSSPTFDQVFHEGDAARLFILSQPRCGSYKLTGRWGFEPGILTEPVAGGDFFDIAAIDDLLGKVITQRLAWESFFARNDLRPVRVSYEKLCRNPVKALHRVAAACGRDPPTLPTDIADGERYALPTGIPS